MGGRITVESVVRCSWNGWPDDRGIRTVVADHGAVNLLFNNAGVALGASLADVRIEDFQWLMNINFWGVVHGTQIFLPHLIASGDGHIVNISSTNGLIGFPRQGTYCSSKFAVRGFTEALRMELALDGVPVSATCVHPGLVNTNIAKSAVLDEKMVKNIGVDVNTLRAQADKLQKLTSVEFAAWKIIRGVKRNSRRVLIGPDAWMIDKLSRLLGAWYQPIVTFITKREMARMAAQAKRVRDGLK